MKDLLQVILRIGTIKIPEHYQPASWLTGSYLIKIILRTSRNYTQEFSTHNLSLYSSSFFRNHDSFFLSSCWEPSLSVCPSLQLPCYQLFRCNYLNAGKSDILPLKELHKPLSLCEFNTELIKRYLLHLPGKKKKKSFLQISVAIL